MERGLELVTEFHEKFGCDINVMPSVLSEAGYNMRYELMKEENEEYLDACDKEDITGILNALGDKLYVLCGTIVSHGFQDIIEPAFVEIHKSNMSKLDKDGNPIINGENGILDESRPVGKVLKGDGYFKPNLEDILQKVFEKALNEKFLDEEFKEILMKKYEDRDKIFREIIEDKLSKSDWNKFKKFEELSDYFSSKVKLSQQRTTFDQTRFGVEIDGEMYWLEEKEESEY